jgi:hypothetical protein
MVNIMDVDADITGADAGAVFDRFNGKSTLSALPSGPEGVEESVRLESLCGKLSNSDNARSGDAEQVDNAELSETFVKMSRTLTPLSVLSSLF